MSVSIEYYFNMFLFADSRLTSDNSQLYTHTHTHVLHKIRWKNMRLDQCFVLE